MVLMLQRKAIMSLNGNDIADSELPNVVKLWSRVFGQLLVSGFQPHMPHIIRHAVKIRIRKVHLGKAFVSRTENAGARKDSQMQCIGAVDVPYPERTRFHAHKPRWNAIVPVRLLADTGQPVQGEYKKRYSE